MALAVYRIGTWSPGVTIDATYDDVTRAISSFQITFPPDMAPGSICTIRVTRRSNGNVVYTGVFEATTTLAPPVSMTLPAKRDDAYSRNAGQTYALSVTVSSAPFTPDPPPTVKG